MGKLAEQIAAYQPWNEQEVRDKELILRGLAENPKIFLRESLTAHMTASAWVLDKAHENVLMAYHNIYRSWAWLGGHADGEEDLLQVALREVREESGLEKIRPLSEDIFSLEVLTVNGHVKHGAYVSSHLHYNLTYLIEATGDEALRIKPDENSGVSWYPPEKAVAMSTEPWMAENIYRKLNEKLRKI